MHRQTRPRKRVADVLVLFDSRGTGSGSQPGKKSPLFKFIPEGCVTEPLPLTIMLSTPGGYWHV